MKEIIGKVRQSESKFPKKIIIDNQTFSKEEDISEEFKGLTP